MNPPKDIAEHPRARLIYWGVPALLMAIVYWYALKCWFLQDDFVWLALKSRAYDFRSLLNEIFRPTVHGTWRPLSERTFFYVFYSMFGLNAFPYHVWEFLTFLADIVLLGSILRRLTGSRAAGLWAGIFWLVNPSMMTAMTWPSAYMQFLCAFFILLAFHFLLRYIETGRRRYYALQVAAFLVGFTAMESTLVYPLLAAGYALLFARKYMRHTLPLFLISAGFYVLHMTFAPKAKVGPYVIHFDHHIPATFWQYWRWAVAPPQAPDVLRFPQWTVPAAVAAITVALAAFLLRETLRRRYVALYLFFWFGALLAPVLPLRDHLAYYYLTLPMMGMGAFGAWAFVRGWNRGGPWRGTAAALAGLYVLLCIPVAFATTKWQYGLTTRVRAFVMTLAAARQIHPDATILLAGVDSDFFWWAIADRPMNMLGLQNVYLAPGSEAVIKSQPGATPVTEFVLPSMPSRADLEAGRVLVLAVDRNMRDITRSWAEANAGRSGLPDRVDVTNPLQASALGQGWYPAEQGYRWMGKRATVRMAGPRTAGQRLYIAAHCHESQLKQGPLTITVSVDGQALPASRVSSCSDEIDLSFPLPGRLVGKQEVEVAAEVDHTITPPGDGRELGLVLGTFAIR